MNTTNKSYGAKKTACVLLVVFAALAPVLCLGDEKIENKPCREHPKLSGACYKVRGRMDFWNGSPTTRIWVVGTKRMLGVSQQSYSLEGYDNIPSELEGRLTWETSMFADFTVCPFEDEKPGKMRLICVESAENVSIRKR